ncbi:unnamed protein product [Angiostrongylus costaricensis]|uniref:Uncharacterized protein n=1 Tax=Angiostrongylus costaricensis TaxID=334426 RepID=A0A0R3PYB4_ANGCS|nr:unnamed protein product [Angiostrongylus costaricensis]
MLQELEKAVCYYDLLTTSFLRIILQRLVLISKFELLKLMGNV